MIKLRAVSLRQLAQLLESGIDPDRALAILADHCDARQAKALRQARRALRHNIPLLDALRQQQLLRADEQARLEALKAAGYLAPGLRDLAEEYLHYNRLVSKIRSGLLLPGIILLIGVIVLPLPAVAGDRLTIGTYCLQTLLIIGLVLMLYNWLLQLVEALADTVEAWRLKLGRSPGLGRRARVFGQLGQLLGGGISASQALMLVANSQPTTIKTALFHASRATHQGTSLTDALLKSGLLRQPADHALIASGEAAGNLAATLKRHADQLSTFELQRWQLFAKLLPSAMYFLVIGVLVAVMLG